MDAEKIVRITPEAISELLDTHRVKATAKQGPGARREERWPFPGTVEIWLPEQCYGERHVLATLHNLHFYLQLVKNARAAILRGEFAAFLRQHEADTKRIMTALGMIKG